MKRASRVGWTVAGLTIVGCAPIAPPVVATTEPIVASAPIAPDSASPVPPGPPAVGATEARPVDAEEQRAELVKAKASFEAFLARAQGKPEYEKAVEEARERIQDIDRMLVFIGGGDAGVKAPP